MRANSTLAKAVRFALIGGATTVALSSMAVYAEEGDNAKVERIEVTGSRIQRTDMESALPVTVLSAEDIAKTGLSDVSAVLAQMPFNTAGSFISDAGSSASNHASSGMRGLGSNRTLTLINGRRIAPSATFGGDATNLNLIPMDAIERIEILRDGASAIYGSDAIGGVINIILKKTFDGLAFDAKFGSPTQGGRDEKSASITFGNTSDKSSSLVIIEHKQFDPLQGGQRPHLTANWDKKYGRSGLYAPEGTYRPVESRPVKGADGTFGTPVYTGLQVPGKDCPADRIVTTKDGSACGFNQFDGTDYLPDQTKDSVFSNMTYRITDELEWFGQAIVMRDKSITSSTALWTPNLYIAADNPLNPTFGTANASEVQAYHRLKGVADRSTEFDSNVVDIVTGLNLELDAGSLSWYVQYSDQIVNIETDSYVFEDKLQEAVDKGLYNPFVEGGNATQATLDTFLHTATRKATSNTTGTGLSWAALAPISLPGGDLGYAVGMEYQKIEYKDSRDAQQAAGNVLGTYGGDSAGDRSYKAAFVELELPVLDHLNVKLASRYDQYSLPDVGQLSSSVNVRYEALDNLVLRASYGQGFRAPSLDDLLGKPATSYDRVTDTTLCQSLPPDQQNGNPACEDNQYLRKSSGNKDLDPEKSAQYSFGAVWNITENIDFVVDYYNIEITDQVSYIGAQTIVDLEAIGGLGAYDPKYIYVKRKADGTIDEIGAGNINMDGVQTSGLDVSFTSNFDLGEIGTFKFAVEGTYALEYTEQASPIAKRYDVLGTKGYPPLRFNTTFSYAIDDFSASLIAKYIDSYDGETPQQQEVGTNKQDFSSFTTWDLTLNYDFDSYGKVTVGARNLFDAMPTVNYSLGYPGYDTDTHNILGRVVFAGYKVKF
ncbi:TonB-dependent receptor plug domain-containing protein [Shewanella xiamenensis]|mgnify:CR=1 FL=1|uniref:TonB-dependent receptor n=4 Tax=Shewanellaceae TaxID=267890 RepID=A0A1E3V1W9_9GAMM|nr:TonB-dependent receptor [Shewanella xiamenensis]MCL1070733.1 TonB-dependent receptor [Shewanella xiamenensis]MCR4533094.1 TonB-dependent receptor [Shewanella xiamenensis]MDG5898945.1 TonB-dependent receptor [Shewanella xiamenensis]ODR87650.1 TonB-dependent receptor [Shewanella xiamenensis]WHF57089.1 TonB-dependent receptor [Shewanella xiamenensis]